MKKEDFTRIQSRKKNEGKDIYKVEKMVYKKIIQFLPRAVTEDKCNQTASQGLGCGVWVRIG
jgi:hypothetical protein